jgi:hypothetical protein
LRAQKNITKNQTSGQALDILLKLFSSKYIFFKCKKDTISGMLSPHFGSVKVEDLALQQGLNDVSKASSERRKKFNGACPMRNDHGEVYCCIKNSRTQWGQTFLDFVFFNLHERFT